jgi:hypothetical protein
MRTYSGDGRPVAQTPYSRSLSDIFADAVAILRQDASEYAFVGLVGAFFGTIAAIVLHLVGSDLSFSLIAPLVFLTALLVYATTAAQVAMVDDQLEPDAGRAFVGVLARAPFLFIAYAPGILLLGIATMLGLKLAGPIPGWAASLAGIALGAGAVYWMFQRSLYVPGLFTRGASAREAHRRAVAIARRAPMALAVAWSIPLAPCLMIALLALALGYGAAATGFTSMLLIIGMPLAAPIMTLLYQQTAVAYDSQAQPLTAMHHRRESDQVSERLGRHMR